VSRNYQNTPAFQRGMGRAVDYAAMYRDLDRATACTCSYEPEDAPGGSRIPNLRCPVHGSTDAAAEALGRVLGGA
jgi:hypothetical protein